MIMDPKSSASVSRLIAASAAEPDSTPVATQSSAQRSVLSVRPIGKQGQRKARPLQHTQKSTGAAMRTHSEGVRASLESTMADGWLDEQKISMQTERVGEWGADHTRIALHPSTRAQPGKPDHVRA